MIVFNPTPQGTASSETEWPRWKPRIDSDGSTRYYAPCLGEDAEWERHDPRPETNASTWCTADSDGMCLVQWVPFLYK